MATCGTALAATLSTTFSVPSGEGLGGGVADMARAAGVTFNITCALGGIVATSADWDMPPACCAAFTAELPLAFAAIAWAVGAISVADWATSCCVKMSCSVMMNDV